jgi:hypothetical protein
MTQRVILLKKEKDDLILASEVEMGISVILIENSGVKIAAFCVTRGRNDSFPNWVIFIINAFS